MTTNNSGINKPGSNAVGINNGSVSAIGKVDDMNIESAEVVMGGHVEGNVIMGDSVTFSPQIIFPENPEAAKIAVTQMFVEFRKLIAEKPDVNLTLPEPLAQKLLESNEEE